MNAKQFLFLIISSATAAIGQILFKLGATGVTTTLEYINYKILLGLLCYGVSTIIWIMCLTYLELVVVYVFTVLTFIFVYILAFFILKEQLTIYGMLGVAIILFGLYLVVVKGI